LLQIRRGLIEVFRKTKNLFEEEMSEVNVSYGKKWCKATLRLNRTTCSGGRLYQMNWAAGELRIFLSKRKISSLSIFHLFSCIYMSQMQFSEAPLAHGEEFSRP
jgi:hypothetical protein